MRGRHISVGAGCDECEPVRAVWCWDVPDRARHGGPAELHALRGGDISVRPRHALCVRLLAVCCGVLPASAGGCLGFELLAVPAGHVPDWIRVVVGSGLHAVQISVVSDGLRDGRRGELLIVRRRDVPDWAGHEQRARLHSLRWAAGWAAVRGVHCKRLWWVLRRQLLVVGHLQRAWTLLWCGSGMRVPGGLVGMELLSSVPGWGLLRGRICDLVWCGDVSKRVWDAGRKQLLGMRGRHVLDRARVDVR